MSQKIPDNIIFNKVIEVKQRFPQIIIADNSIDTSVFIQKEQEILAEMKTSKAVYDQAKINKEKMIMQQQILRNQSLGVEAMAARQAEAKSEAEANPNVPRSLRKRGRQEYSVEEKTIQDALKNAKNDWETSKKVYQLLKKFDEEIQEAQNKYANISASYNSKNDELQSIIERITAYNSTYEQVYTEAMRTGEISSTLSHNEARQAARIAAKCEQASSSTVIVLSLIHI